LDYFFLDADFAFDVAFAAAPLASFFFCVCVFAFTALGMTASGVKIKLADTNADKNFFMKRSLINASLAVNV
jgi:hypothetical protein